MYISSLACVPMDKKWDTIIRIVKIKNIEVGVIKNGCKSFEFHFRGEVSVGQSLRVEGGFGNIEKGIKE